MAKITITIDDANAAIVAALGADAVASAAADKGYTTEIHNPDYVPAVGTETINDPAHTPPDDYNAADYVWPQIPNPDYVAAVGNPTIPNPDSEGQYLAKKVLHDAIIPYLFKEKESRARKEVEAQIKQAKDVVETAAQIVVE